jgi:acetylornithine/succinyldiaminopimelate/putrescine aminotransferase
MLGIEFDGPGADVVGQCLREGLLINCTADRVLRITPPLIITADEVDQGLALLDRSLAASA